MKYIKHINESKKFEPKENRWYVHKKSGQTWQLNWLDTEDNEAVMVKSGGRPLTKRIKLKNFHKNWEEKILEMDKTGWGDDPKKPKAIDKVEAKVWKWVNSLKKGWTPNTQYSPKLARLRQEWENVIDKHKDQWQPKYNFGDLLA